MAVTNKNGKHLGWSDPSWHKLNMLLLGKMSAQRLCSLLGIDAWIDTKLVHGKRWSDRPAR